MISRDSCVERDRADQLAPLREQFDLPAGVVYLDGNSLGALPRTVAARIASTIESEWGRGLVRSWNEAGWMDLPRVVGDKIARIIGARSGDVVVADSTSVDLYKVLHAAAGSLATSDPRRRVILSERGNFPTDLYIAQSVATLGGAELVLVDGDVTSRFDDTVAVVMLTHVDYRTGSMHDMAAITRAAHDAGALVVWDLSHSAGVVPIDLHGVDADAAVGCGYKFLNGGPGAPAYVWVHPRHADTWLSPLPGWLGHAAPFDFTSEYAPAAGVARFQCGTPPILSLVALDCGIETVLAAERRGGLGALAEKSGALTSLFIELVDEMLGDEAINVVSPRDTSRRGSHVSLRHEHAYGIVRALIDRGVIGDFRAPDIARFGVSPLYTRFVDMWDAASHLGAVLRAEEWSRDEYRQRLPVT